MGTTIREKASVIAAEGSETAVRNGIASGLTGRADRRHAATEPSCPPERRPGKPNGSGNSQVFPFRITQGRNIMLHLAFNESLHEEIVTVGAPPGKTASCQTLQASSPPAAKGDDTEYDGTAGLADNLIYAKIFATPWAVWSCATIGAIIGLVFGALLADSHGALIGGAIGILFGKILCSIATDGRYD